MGNPTYTYKSNIYVFVDWVLWYINHCRLFDTKSPSCIYIKYIWFVVGFYCISAIGSILMQNLIDTYILNIWFVNTLYW